MKTTLAILLLAPTMATAQAQQQPGATAGQAPAGAKITQEQAKKIALERIPGEVTEVTIEKKKGKEVYVIEIQTSKGEKDVFVDMESGKIVGTE